MNKIAEMFPRIDSEKEPEGKLEIYADNDDLDIDATVSAYHFLRDRLSYDKDLQERFQKYCKTMDMPVCGYSAVMFAECISKKKPIVVYTKDDDNDLLSHALKFVCWEDTDGAHIIIQVFNGIWSDPLAFNIKNIESLFQNSHGVIYCDNCAETWITEDGHSWDGLESWESVYDKPKYLVPSFQGIFPDFPELKKSMINVIWIDDNRDGHCPYCGGILKLRGSYA